jgi:DNA-binding IclR family transcriptional regulator
VFGPSGRPQFMIGARVMRSSMPHREISAIARRVREAADSVTESIGGTDPWAAYQATPNRPEHT